MKRIFFFIIVFWSIQLFAAQPEKVVEDPSFSNGEWSVVVIG